MFITIQCNKISDARLRRLGIRHFTHRLETPTAQEVKKVAHYRWSTSFKVSVIFTDFLYHEAYLVLHSLTNHVVASSLSLLTNAEQGDYRECHNRNRAN